MRKHRIVAVARRVFARAGLGLGAALFAFGGLERAAGQGRPATSVLCR